MGREKPSGGGLMLELLAFILTVVGAFCGAILLMGLMMWVFTGKFPD